MPGKMVKAWHFDGRTNDWYSTVGTTIGVANGASAVAAGAAALLATAALF